MLSEKNWYLIYTKSRKEETARENLERQGFTAYLPRMNVERRVRGKYQIIAEVMFPRYLFVQLDTTSDNWIPIRSTIGVQNMVQFGGIMAKAPDSLIVTLKNQETQHNHPVDSKTGFSYGDAVEFVAGSFQGYKAIFDKYVSSDRVAVLLSIIGEYTRTFVSRHDLEPA